MAITTPIFEQRRIEACKRLADILEQVNATAAALTNRLVRLSTRDYASDQKAIASFANYQTASLLCSDEVREVEALLRGESIADTISREEDRRAADIEKAAASKLNRQGYVQIPDGDGVEGLERNQHCRSIVAALWSLPGSELADLAETLRDRTKRGQKVKRATRKPRAAKPAPASPFKVIEGGRG